MDAELLVPLVVVSFLGIVLYLGYREDRKRRTGSSGADRIIRTVERQPIENTTNNPNGSGSDHRPPPTPVPVQEPETIIDRNVLESLVFGSCDQSTSILLRYRWDGFHVSGHKVDVLAAGENFFEVYDHQSYNIRILRFDDIVDAKLTETDFTPQKDYAPSPRIRENLKAWVRSPSPYRISDEQPISGLTFRDFVEDLDARHVIVRKGEIFDESGEPCNIAGHVAYRLLGAKPPFRSASQAKLTNYTTLNKAFGLNRDDAKRILAANDRETLSRNSSSSMYKGRTAIARILWLCDVTPGMGDTTLRVKRLPARWSKTYSKPPRDDDKTVAEPDPILKADVLKSIAEDEEFDTIIETYFDEWDPGISVQLIQYLVDAIADASDGTYLELLLPLLLDLERFSDDERSDLHLGVSTAFKLVSFDRERWETWAIELEEEEIRHKWYQETLCTPKILVQSVEDLVSNKLTGHALSSGEVELVINSGIDAMLVGIDSFRRLAVTAANAEFRSDLELFAECVLDNIKFVETNGGADWRDRIRQGFRAEIIQITRLTNLQTGRAMKQAGDEMIRAVKPGFEAVIKEAAPELLRLVDKHVP